MWFRNRLFNWVFMFSACSSACTSVELNNNAAADAGAQRQLVTETFMVPARDPGIQLHLRNKHPAGVDRFDSRKIVLFVHGATYPGESGFDVNLPGGSWLEFAAKRGFDAYLVDIRGYGRSTRPALMNQPPAAHPPFADTADAVKDIGAAVEFILQRRGATKLNLVGWSWGTATTGTYTASNNDKVEKLVLYAPLGPIKEAAPISGGGAYRTVQREAARNRTIRGIAENRVDEISPRAWFDQVFDAILATDPAGAAQNPPVVRAPNGVIKDIGEYWSKGKSTYDPAELRVPTLLIVAEWDQDTPVYMAQELFAKMKNSPNKRLTILGEGTHFIVQEKHRMKLIGQVQQFLDE